MSEMLDAVKDHHAQLFGYLSRFVAGLDEAGTTVNAGGLADFLKAELLPHARGEERSLYPAVEPLVKAHGQATTTMTMDHEFIADYVRQIDETTHALGEAHVEDRPALERRLSRLAIGLEAILHLHLAKEERVYLPLLEHFLSVDEQRRVLDGLHEA